MNSLSEFQLEVNDSSVKVSIPVLEITGDEGDQTLFIFASLHGDEYEASSAIYELKEYLKSQPISGKILAFPISNPLAFYANERCTPKEFDGKNLARSFPGSADGTITEKIANVLWQFVLSHQSKENFLLDLHSGGQHYSYTHLSGVRDMQLTSKQSKISMDLARAMLIKNLWLMPATEGTLSTEAIRAGIPAIGCEVEGTGGLNKFDVNVYLNGILNVLRYTKQLQIGELILETAQFKPIETINSPTTGFISQIPKLHTKLNEGEVICQLLNEYGEVSTEVLSPCTGELWAIRRNPSIRKDEILAIISKERN